MLCTIDDETEAFVLIDAENAFNFISRKVMLHNISIMCAIILTSISDFTTQKIKFSIKDFFSKCDQIHRKLPIWLHSLKKSYFVQ